MAPGRSDVQSPEHGTPKVEEDVVVDGVDRLGIGSSSNEEEDGVQVTCFTDVVDDVTLHFQIIRLHKQNNIVSVTNILGGASDNTGSGIVRRLVLKTGLNVILACNIPKNSPMLEADAEKKLVQKLINLGYTKPKSNGSSS
ncbi:hypothetical protein Acr_24g0000310 [Actinidia rufa]|uniref:Uncharacterized protein n=1 Tax=Actinidia rufa TaxID=165716 RepID=A0A7J0GT01_9ERIC|nr:hypothetical protein Acr_24g0000310 [Actinidia rufa]